MKKASKKRAADVLDDAPAKAGSRKSQSKTKTGKSERASLTADGTNGVVEHSSDEEITITTAKQPQNKSLMAGAERTQDQELEDEFGQGGVSLDNEEDNIDAAPALLTGFDSDNDDPAEDTDFDSSRVQPIPQYKKTSKKLRKAKEGKSDGPGVIYIGRIPHGFYETQMREYFSQFGEISRLRLSRNKKTGASKHFAFIEFESDEVAKIAAEAMDNYLMFGHILKCKYAPEGSLHADVWKGANKKFRKIPHHKLAREKAEQPKTDEQIEKKIKKEQNKRDAKAKKLKAIGYEFEMPELKKPQQPEQATPVEKEEQSRIEDKVEGAIVPPDNVPKDELAVKVEENAKKSKKSKKAKDAVDAEPSSNETTKSKTSSRADMKPVSKITKKANASQKDKKQIKGILKKPKAA